MIDKLLYIQHYINCRYHKAVAAFVVLCFMLSSCQQDIPSVSPDAEQLPILMSATATETTTSSRALITNNSELQGVCLGVYATKIVATNDPVLVFNNTKLEYKNSVWDYSPKRYWDRTASYNFVAYAPYSVSANPSYTPSTNTLTISNIPYWQTINKDVTDYLVANSSGTANSYLNNQTSTAVSFNFTHILSQFVVKIVKDATVASVNYKLTKVEYINVPASDGKAKYTYSPSSTSSFLENSSNSSTSSISSTSSKSMLEYDASKAPAITLANADSPITLSHLVVPFSGSKVQIKVTYTIEGTTREKTVDTQLSALESGKSYALTLTFKGASIEPSLEIKKWVDATVDEDPKYNW